MTKDKGVILVAAQKQAEKQKLLSPSTRWFPPEQVELVRVPDKTVGWVVGKDCETLRIVLVLDTNRVHLFDQDEIVLIANEEAVV
ncbi:MAG TPA: hypothetical protein PLQ44_02330 [Candidatus Paceibacterota bacterium]|jgi:hypothetical protein|nr:hypothetical protein [Candidatus Paceibacterota bacterium]HPT40416.1 hypothetical protein [Candidatus Paceibacterota bacterium]